MTDLTTDLATVIAESSRNSRIIYSRAAADVCAMVAGSMMAGALFAPDSARSAQAMCDAMRWQWKGVILSALGPVDFERAVKAAESLDAMDSES